MSTLQHPAIAEWVELSKRLGLTVRANRSAGPGEENLRVSAWGRVRLSPLAHREMVVAQLVSGSQTVAGVAIETGLDRRIVGQVLDRLVVDGIAELDGGRYRLMEGKTNE